MLTDDDTGMPELQWPIDPGAFARTAASAVRDLWPPDDKGTTVTRWPAVTRESIAPDAYTIDDMLRGHVGAITRRMLQLEDELLLAAVLFPRPIMERVRDNARTGLALRRYRGVHRHGAWTVAGLTEAIAGQAAASRAAHRRSLRRPQEPMVYIGSRVWTGQWYGVLPDGGAVPATATLTLLPPDDGVLTVPVLGQRDVAADEAATGPIIIAP